MELGAATLCNGTANLIHQNVLLLQLRGESRSAFMASIPKRGEMYPKHPSMLLDHARKNYSNPNQFEFAKQCKRQKSW